MERRMTRRMGKRKRKKGGEKGENTGSIDVLRIIEQDGLRKENQKRQ
jgi:hypothetical protein